MHLGWVNLGPKEANLNLDLYNLYNDKKMFDIACLERWEGFMMVKPSVLEIELYALKKGTEWTFVWKNISIGSLAEDRF